MLEVKHLSKIYKSTVKNGVDTKALDDVSLTFPDKGMVFLLGKSGSGNLRF
jgi:ABC-type oligopeptide transport system ATPase subunit